MIGILAASNSEWYNYSVIHIAVMSLCPTGLQLFRNLIGPEANHSIIKFTCKHHLFLAKIFIDLATLSSFLLKAFHMKQLEACMTKWNNYNVQLTGDMSLFLIGLRKYLVLSLYFPTNIFTQSFFYCYDYFVK